MKTTCKTINSYNVEENGCIFYHALATSESHVQELAAAAGYDLTGMTIELERENVRNELGEAYGPRIENAFV